MPRPSARLARTRLLSPSARSHGEKDKFHRMIGLARLIKNAQSRLIVPGAGYLGIARAAPGERLIMRALLLVPALCVALPASAQQPPPSTVPVGVVQAELKPISKNADFVGRVESINRVQIVARVTGFLDEVNFKEGDVVKDGTPFYLIEQGLFKAAVESAQGALERSKAAKTLTEIQLSRAQELFNRQAGTAVARDQALAADQQAAGQILTDQANLDTAKINLGYTEINSPITGKVGRTNITKGNVVGSDSGSLTRVVSQDPMYVTFPVSQVVVLEATREGQKNIDSIKVKLKFSDGSTYDEVGQINFVDVTVDRGTDSVTVRATIANPKGLLIDGQLVRVILESGTPTERLVIPQAALIADQQGVYVFVVDDGKATVRRIKPGDESGTGIVVESGLSAGDLVIVEGLQSLRPGTPVRAAPMPAVAPGG
jgi:membrane fusion protein, multidrug efflux system